MDLFVKGSLTLLSKPFYVRSQGAYVSFDISCYIRHEIKQLNNTYHRLTMANHIVESLAVKQKCQLKHKRFWHVHMYTTITSTFMCTTKQINSFVTKPLIFYSCLNNMNNNNRQSIYKM